MAGAVATGTAFIKLHFTMAGRDPSPLEADRSSCSGAHAPNTRAPTTTKVTGGTDSILGWGTTAHSCDGGEAGEVRSDDLTHPGSNVMLNPGCRVVKEPNNTVSSDSVNHRHCASEPTAAMVIAFNNRAHGGPATEMSALAP